MLSHPMPAPVPNHTLSRPKYPSPLDFHPILPHSMPPQIPTSPNRVHKDPPPLSAENNCRYEHDGSRAQDIFGRNNSTATSSEAYAAMAQNVFTSQSTSQDSEINNGYISKSPSPTEGHPTSSFPHPLSAPHSQEHFSNTGSPPFGSDMSRYTPLHSSDRYVRNGTHHQHPPGPDKYSFPLLDQRRMSEPSIFGSSGSAHASAYPNPNAEPTTGRYQQMQFAFNPPPQSPPSPYSPLHRGLSTGSLHDLGHHHQQRSPAWKSDDHMQLHLHSISGVGLDEPISPLHPTFSRGLHSPTLAQQYPSLADDAYGPSPPGTGTSTSSNAPAARPGGAGTGSSSSSNSKTYSFVSLPGNAVKKRPRRRYDEIERLYQCSWPDCTKAYGTLNHLNAHVTMQKHGSKRNPNGMSKLHFN